LLVRIRLPYGAFIQHNVQLVVIIGGHFKAMPRAGLLLGFHFLDAMRIVCSVVLCRVWVKGIRIDRVRVLVRKLAGSPDRLDRVHLVCSICVRAIRVRRVWGTPPARHQVLAPKACHGHYVEVSTKALEFCWVSNMAEIPTWLGFLIFNWRLNCEAFEQLCLLIRLAFAIYLRQRECLSQNGQGERLKTALRQSRTSL
jgi:hypothetical protein